MDANFICYDGVDGNITFFNTEEEAVKELNELIQNGLEGGEWIYNIENSFVAKISHDIKKTKFSGGIAMDIGEAR